MYFWSHCNMTFLQLHTLPEVHLQIFSPITAPLGNMTLLAKWKVEMCTPDRNPNISLWTINNGAATLDSGIVAPYFLQSIPRVFDFSHQRGDKKIRTDIWLFASAKQNIHTNIRLISISKTKTFALIFDFFASARRKDFLHQHQQHSDLMQKRCSMCAHCTNQGWWEQEPDSNGLWCKWYLSSILQHIKSRTDWASWILPWDHKVHRKTHTLACSTEISQKEGQNLLVIIEYI